MNKEKEIIKQNFWDLSEYRLPDVPKLQKIFDAVPKTIAPTGFNIFEYENVFEDKATQELIRTGNTIGCFYIESPGMRSLLQKTDCHTFEMLTAVSSIIRPGVASSGMLKEFIERHKNPKRRKYLLPEMEEYLGETYGVMVYQEDVIKVAHHIIGLSLEEADFLRRAMSGKMRSHKAMQMIVDKFFNNCKQKGYSNQVTQELWKQIESFAQYAFCKAHSASFALLSFQMAYLKAHFPAYFFAAVLTNQGGYYSPAVYVSEAKRLGIKILLPCINNSFYEYKANDNEIRIGFMAIKNFQQSEAELIIKERTKNGKYISLIDFLIRTKIGYEHCESLIKCGAMDCFNLTRPTLLRLLDIYFSHKRLLNEAENNLFINESIKLEKEVITEKDFSIEEKCICELETFGYMVSQHPLEFFKDEIQSANVIQSSEMEKYKGKKVKMIGWYMTSKRIVTTKGDIMKFLSLEDLNGTFEAVIFPNVYERFAEQTLSMGAFVVEGKVDEENSNNIIVEELSVMTGEKAKSITQKDRTDIDFFGDTEKPATLDEIMLVNTLDKERLVKAYL
ncbi:hypothetical protein D9V86_00270 [Bacteroidetes/Chlorobi group bacterium ChocPot_Mid]|nr:MAG: hypothetical protein D9V86_00270 [Bacteroidetes/Chlorobi group bacterium ChocPot_Mid]